ncbi:MAG: hypothetical protein WC788_05445 [Candidatus Paceibacterota bacterium]|jgi:hypothetical protein
MVLEMESILYGFVIAFLSFFYLGWENDRFSVGRTLTVNLLGTIVGGIIFAILFWLDPPAFVGMWGGWYRVVAAPMIIGAVACIFISIESDGKGTAIQIIKLLAVIVTGLIILFTPVFHANQLYSIPQVTEIENISVPNGILDPIDLKHIRLVDQDMAYSLGSKIIGKEANLGSQYEVIKKDFHIQEVAGHLWWVAPLQFQGFTQWNSIGTSPGFIMVDAEDPFAEPLLKTGYQMKYLTSSFWGTELYRYTYSQGYSDYVLEDLTFEVTDNLKPKWTISKTRPTINNDGYITKSVIVVDPVDGKIEEYAIGNVPEWIDRVVPERIATDYISWYGAYPHGWWNSRGLWYVANKDVNEPTTITTKDGDKVELFFVYGSDNKPYWFGGMTSPSSSDQSLTSIVLIGARDGIMYKFKMTGGNEQVALDAANSAVSQYTNWYGSAPVPYNVFGTLTYIMPISSHTDKSGNIFQRVAFIDALDSHAVIGETKDVAAENYKSYLATKGVQVALTASTNLKTIVSIVVRMGSVVIGGHSDYWLWLNNSDIIYAVNPMLWPEVVETSIGDEVNISYADTGDVRVVANKFDNKYINARVSKEQIALDRDTANTTAQKVGNWDEQEDLKNKLKELQK